MPAAEMEKWLSSGRYARIGSLGLRPQEHSQMRGTPLSVARAQAEAFCLNAEDGQRWILKRFHQGKSPNRSYLTAVASLLPAIPECVAGTARRVLARSDLCKARGYYYDGALAGWMEDAVLMPRVSGISWACIADDERAGDRGCRQARPCPRVGRPDASGRRSR